MVYIAMSYNMKRASIFKKLVFVL